MKDICNGEGPNVVHRREYVGINDESFPFTIRENDEGRESSEEQHRIPVADTSQMGNQEWKDVDLLRGNSRAETPTSRPQHWTHGCLRSLWKRLDTTGSRVAWLGGACERVKFMYPCQPRSTQPVKGSSTLLEAILNGEGYAHPPETPPK